jgi:hypothetical protein
METVVGLVVAGMPFVVVSGLLVMLERRQERTAADVARQIALTDALHARLGALVAPVVRRRRRLWQIEIAVPVEQPAVVASVLATVDEVFGRVAYEVRLRRQSPPISLARAPRAARAAQESLSWT